MGVEIVVGDASVSVTNEPAHLVEWVGVHVAHADGSHTGCWGSALGTRLAAEHLPKGSVVQHAMFHGEFFMGQGSHNRRKLVKGNAPLRSGSSGSGSCSDRGRRSIRRQDGVDLHHVDQSQRYAGIRIDTHLHLCMMMSSLVWSL